MLIMGSMIGSGIFIVPAKMSLELGSPLMLIAAWVATAILTIFAALSYGELAAMMPKAGGQYVYLKEAYGRLTGFLYGWTFFTVIQTGTIAAVGVAFAVYSHVFFEGINDMPILELAGVALTSKKIVAVSVVWMLTLSNFRGIRSGALIQNLFTFTKIGALLFMIGAGLYFIFTQPPVAINWTIPEAAGSYQYWGLFCAALVGSIFSSDAWNNVTFTGSEIENPRRNLPYSLLIGTASVLLLYILINYIYLYALPFDQIQHAEDGRVGTQLLNQVFGREGVFVMAALIMVSTFGCINGLTLSGARVYYAMAHDGLFFKKAGELNTRQSPRYALVIQGIWASILTLSGGYNALLDYVVIAVLFFYVLTVSAVFVLRVKKPDAERTYKVWGYPLVPFLYIIMATYICISLLMYRTSTTWPGLAIVLTGIPVFYLVNRKG
jgi:basic amino acid/polyamine antiporter, APA family